LGLAKAGNGYANGGPVLGAGTVLKGVSQTTRPGKLGTVGRRQPGVFQELLCASLENSQTKTCVGLG